MLNHISPCNHPESDYTGSTIESMIERTKELHVPYFSITDHGRLISVLKGYSYALKHEIKIVPGVEVYFKDDECPIIQNTASQQIRYFKLIIHAKDQTAYQYLAKLTSNLTRKKVKIGDNEFRLFNWQDLTEISKFNVTVCTSDIECMVAKHLLVNNPKCGLEYYKKLKELFQDNFYPAILPIEHDKYWNTVVQLKAGDKTIQIPTSDKIETDAYKSATAIELTKKYSKHRSLEAVYINNLRFRVDKKYRQISDAELLNTFQDLPSDLQLNANKFIIALAKRFSDLNNLLINNYSYYATAEDQVVQSMRLGEENRIAQKQHIRTIDEITPYLKEKLGFDEQVIEQLVQNSYNWADKFKDFELKYEYKLPNCGENVEQRLVDIIKRKGRMKWDNPRYLKQFREEYELLVNNGVVNLIPYFLPIVDISEFYDKAGYLVGPGRGSASGFLLSYLLGITQIDPLKYGLSSARFLTLDRVKQSNFPDIDFDTEDREPLVGADGNSGYLFGKYGNCAAQVSTRTLLRIKSSILDVNRFINKGAIEPIIEEFVKSLPSTPQGITDSDFVFGYEDADGNRVQGLLESNKDLLKYTEERPNEWEIVKRALSLPRQNSRHASAFCVANEPIENIVPTFEINGIRVTQPEAKQCEFSGLIKFDFLVVSALKDIRLCLDYINKKQTRKTDQIVGWYHLGTNSAMCYHCDPNIDTSDEVNCITTDLDYHTHESAKLWDEMGNSVPCDTCRTYLSEVDNLKTGYFTHNDKKTFIWDLPEDSEVFKMLAEGQTETIFQFNTKSVTPFVQVIQPKSIAECATITALVRPGPLDFHDEISGRNMVEEYVERRFGRSVGSINILNELIPETYGILVFQEQVQRIAKELGGMSVEDSENVRIAMGKKKIKLLNSLKPAFIEGASKKVDKETAEKIWSMMATFAGYSFNLSHAVSYSVISYACAFLKYHYPLEWWAAVLSNADDKEINESLSKYVKDMMSPPDINLSEEVMVVDYTHNKIRGKLSIISGIGDNAANKIIKGRPYTNIQDFVNKKVCGDSMTKKLIHVGVLDSLFEPNVDIMQKMKEYENAVVNKGFQDKIANYDLKIKQFEDKQDPKGTEKAKKNKAVFIAKGKKESIVDPFYIGLTEQKNFLIKKSIFPSMFLDLDGVLYEHSNTRILKAGNARLITNNFGRETKLFPADYLQRLDELTMNSDFYFCTPGYVVDMKEFTYKNGSRKALKLIIDSSGYVSEKVIWPDYNTGKLHYSEDLSKGCIAYFFYKKKEGRSGTNIYDVIVEEKALA